MIAALAEDRDSAREALITSFAVLGEEHELVPEYRRRLASALY
jgi:thioredoxin-like negative regulator of GroEL